MGTAASEEHEYVKVCGVKTHVEASGHGSLGDVHYTIVFSEDGDGGPCSTIVVSKWVGTEVLDTDHTNVYGISITVDATESVVAECSSGDYVGCAITLLMKLSTGYSSGVVGVAEVTPRTSVTCD